MDFWTEYCFFRMNPELERQKQNIEEKGCASGF